LPSIAEGAVAHVAELAVALGDLEEAVALDGEVERVAGLLQVALQEELDRARDLGAGADLQAGGHLLVGDRGRARLAQRRVQERAEVDAVPLERRGVHVRDVVRDRVDLGLLAIMPEAAVRIARIILGSSSSLLLGD
jgi:hypothetical protein